MDATVVVAALGFLSTLLAAWLGAYLQHRRTRELQLLEAKLRVYGDCAAALVEFQRATYNRVKARIDRPNEDREALRQEAYRGSTSVRAAIGQAAILSGNQRLWEQFEAARKAIGDLNHAKGQSDLRQRHDEVSDELIQVLNNARSDLMH